MPVHIKQLNCRVVVRTGTKEQVYHQTQKPVRPALDFASPLPQPTLETQPEPSLTATEDFGNRGATETVSPKKADARAVADRVYELMTREATLGRLREKPW